MMRALLATLLTLLLASPAAAGFYPACLKRDGDWLHGISKKQCRALGGRWRAR